MTKGLFIICIVFFLTLNGCNITENSGSMPASATIDENQAEKTYDDIQSEASKVESQIKEPEENDSDTPILTETQQWVSTILKEGYLVADLNKDGIDDSVSMEISVKGGAPYISRFELALDQGGSFVISESEQSYDDYDADLEQIELFDFNADGVNEIILLFDSHGVGGNGTHDIFVLWIDPEKQIVGKLLVPCVQLDDSVEIPFEMDSIYGIQKVSYEGKERIQTHQYLWGEEGHSDDRGDLVCIVTLEENSDTFVAEAYWTVPIENALYR